MKQTFLRFVIAAVVLGFLFPMPWFSQEKQDHQPIVESVEVNWWQVPIFAVDGSGNPITDLKETDIEVRVNNRPVKEFEFYKRSFTVTQPEEAAGGGEPGPEKQETQPEPALKDNMVFLLFDVSLSALTCTKRSKEIAARIIADAEPGMQFVVLTIEPFIGLNHVYGPGKNKEELLRSIKKKVIGKPNNRIVDSGEFFGGSMPDSINRQIGGVQNRESGSDSGQMQELAATYYLRKNRCFFDAFKSLYLVFNSIADNKFVYFFSEGLSNSMKGSSMGGESLYNFHLKRIANYLGRSGAVLFIVNPMGIGDAGALVTGQRDANSNAAGSAASSFDAESARSGEGWLRYLAHESGGKYLEGGNELIVNTLQHIHRAYYEISFPDIPGLKGDSRHITIKSKRNNTTIHSLRSLEKYRRYTKMTKLEKEMTALNIVVKNPLVKSALSIEPAQITHVARTKHEVIYTVLLPKEFLDQQLDLYKIRLKNDREVTSIEKEKLVPVREKFDITFSASGANDNGINTYFVLVDGKSQKVLARVVGDEQENKEEK